MSPRQQSHSRGLTLAEVTVSCFLLALLVTLTGQLLLPVWKSGSQELLAQDSLRSVEFALKNLENEALQASAIGTTFVSNSSGDWTLLLDERLQPNSSNLVAWDKQLIGYHFDHQQALLQRKIFNGGNWAGAAALTGTAPPAFTPPTVWSLDWSGATPVAGGIKGDQNWANLQSGWPFTVNGAKTQLLHYTLDLREVLP